MLTLSRVYLRCEATTRWGSGLSPLPAMDEHDAALGFLWLGQLRRQIKGPAQLASPFRNPIRCFDQAAIAAAFFCFLRRARNTKTPRPDAKSGSAAGIEACVWTNAS